jgi:ABC-2 type transport system ATP-binding protein
MPVLVAEKLTKRYGTRAVVDDVSFALEEGEVFGFLGPNGAGKTTVRMLTGLVRPDSGSVSIGGFDIRRDFPGAAPRRAIVRGADLCGALGRETEIFAHDRRHGDPPRRRARGLVAAGRRLDDRVGTYSLGMRQRLGIAQALLGDHAS